MVFETIGQRAHRGGEETRRQARLVDARERFDVFDGVAHGRARSRAEQ